jgi:predicted nucleic acid-binding protein
VAKRSARATPHARHAPERRYSVDASVFVNAFNPHETGHAASLAALTAIQERGDPIVVPALLLTEVASAVARANDDTAGTMEYVDAIAGLPNVTLVTLTPAVARQAADLAATHRLRGADAVYVAVSLRYGTVLVTRDDEQRKRGAAAVTCRTPEEALA